MKLLNRTEVLILEERRKGGVILNGIIDVLIFAYMLSIFVMSFDEDLNKYSKILALALMGMLAVYVFATQSIRINVPVFCLIGFVAWGYLSWFWAADKAATLDRGFTMIQLLALFWLLYNYLSNEDKVETLIKILAWAGVAFAVYIFISNGIDGYISGLRAGDRMGLEGANENSIGVTAGFSALVSLWYTFYKKKYYYFIFAAITTFVALGTGSRKVILMLFVGIILLFVLEGNTKKRFLAIVEGAAVLLLLYAVLQLPIFDTIMDRYDSMITILRGGRSSEGSMYERMKMISLGLDQFLETPLTGLGLNNSSIVTARGLGWSTYLHNNYVELLACVGLIGFALYYAIYIIPIKNLIKGSFKGNDVSILALVLLSVSVALQIGAVQYYEKTEYFILLIFVIAAERFGQKNESDSEGVYTSK